MGRIGGVGSAAKIAKDFPHDQALDAADDSRIALSLGGAALDVAEDRLVGEHTHDHDTVECGVGLVVPAAIQQMPAGLSHGGGARFAEGDARGRREAGWSRGARSTLPNTQKAPATFATALQTRASRRSAASALLAAGDAGDGRPF